MSTLADTPLFESDQERARFPSPIALALDIMVSEFYDSGEITTADETAAAIEATFLWLGRIWVAEYLHAIETDGSLSDKQINQSILALTQSPRGLTTGRWVGMARAIRHRLGANTVIQDLNAISFGETANQLLTFRNHFSHGSFSSSLAEIRTHRVMLHDYLAQVPALRDQVPLCKDPETGVIRQANGHWTPFNEPVHIEPSHPTIRGPKGALLNLYPLLHVTPTATGLRLSGPNTTHPIDQLTARAGLAAWLTRYQFEQQGHLPFSLESVQSTHSGVLTDMRTHLSGLLLIEGHPGCGLDEYIIGLSEQDPNKLGLDAFAAIGRVNIIEQDLGQSAYTVANLILRLTERALNEPDGTRTANMAELLGTLKPLTDAFDALETANQRICLGIANLHLGLTPYRNEPMTVYQLFERLIHPTITVIATSLTNAIRRPLFDHKITVPIVDTPTATDVQHAVDRFVANKPLNQSIITALAQRGESTLFEICDALEADGGTVFEPAVEHALWSMQPILKWHRKSVTEDSVQPERIRLWSTFSPAVDEALMQLEQAK